MKKIKQILVVVLILASIISCDKEEDASQIDIKQETISAKWNVDGTSVFKSFEFNKNGNYIIVKKEGSVTAKLTEEKEVVLFGTYQILDSETLFLSDFGTIKITSINQDTMDYNITLEDSEKSVYAISVNKADEMAASVKTELLCKTWKLVETNGYESDDADGVELFLFSKAGTYLASLLIPQSIPDTEMAKWKWLDGTEKKILWSYKETPEWNIDNEDEGEAEIVALSENRLEILEIVDSKEYNYVYVPYTGVKTNKVITAKATSKTAVKKGMFGR